ncbi:hypothetical protein CYMTET_16602 [Cymbomonas tetramitiformis]|uniref:Uncharacterized protein n=1 Tax=Cymbomonas tetramitiformis TaxID=36881 RepID=A0AAE0GD27_9CHLO|nr:hypothetical protein CYMTET_16602 [Cymbomonas tetramitiformis]
MLSTQQELFEHQYKERQLDLSMKEMEVEQANLAVSISVAALIAGFASAVLVGSLSIDIGTLALKNFIFFTTLSCIAFQLFAILKGCICMIRAPNLAYRGHTKTSVQRAVDQMVLERPAIFWSFVMGLLTFFLIIMGMLWVKLGVVGDDADSEEPCNGQCLYTWHGAFWLSIMTGFIILFFCYTVMRLISREFEDDDEPDTSATQAGLAAYPKDFRYVPSTRKDASGAGSSAGSMTSSNPLREVGPQVGQQEPEAPEESSVTKTIQEVYFPKLHLPKPNSSMFTMTVRPVQRGLEE